MNTGYEQDDVLAGLAGVWDDEQAQQDKETGGPGGDFFKPKDGESVVRFFPPPAGSRQPMLVTHNHYIEFDGPQGKSGIGFNCPRQMGGQYCPACARADELSSSPNKADRDAAWEWKPKLRVYAVVVDRDDERAGPQVFPFGKMIYDKIMAFRTGRGGGNFTNPLTGFDVVIVKTGAKKDTRYDAVAVREDSPLHPDRDVMVEWLQSRPMLDKYGIVLEQSELKELLGKAGLPMKAPLLPAQSQGRGLPSPGAQQPMQRGGPAGTTQAVQRGTTAATGRAPTVTQPTRRAADDVEGPAADGTPGKVPF